MKTKERYGLGALGNSKLTSIAAIEERDETTHKLANQLPTVIRGIAALLMGAASGATVFTASQ